MNSETALEGLPQVYQLQLTRLELVILAAWFHLGGMLVHASTPESQAITLRTAKLTKEVLKDCEETEEKLLNMFDRLTAS